MLSSGSVECVSRSVEPQVCLGEGQDYGQKAQNNGPHLIAKYTLTIFAPNNLYEPAILRCKTREEFLDWLHITRRCGYFHEVSTNRALSLTRIPDTWNPNGANVFNRITSQTSLECKGDML
jgi:hypothetical protein